MSATPPDALRADSPDTMDPMKGNPPYACPSCGSRTLHVVECRVVDINGRFGVPLTADGFTIRHVFYETADVVLRCTHCERRMSLKEALLS